MGQVLNVVKKVAITVAKSEAVKAGTICAAKGAGAVLGFTAGLCIGDRILGLRSRIKNRGKKKGLDEGYSEVTEETEEE